MLTDLEDVAGEFGLRGYDQCLHDRTRSTDPYECVSCIAAALRAVHEQGRREGMEEAEARIRLFL